MKIHTAKELNVMDIEEVEKYYEKLHWENSK